MLRRSLNRLPLFPLVAQLIVPTAAHWCEKYNEAVVCASEKGYAVSFDLPVVPIKRKKVFQGVEDESNGGGWLTGNDATKLNIHVSITNMPSRDDRCSS